MTMEIFSKIKLLILGHKAASLTAAALLAAGALGGGGYAVYKHLQPEAATEVAEEVQEDTATEDVYVPDFKTVYLKSESVEKDLTIYLTDADDNCITGEAFSVKLVSKETAEALQPYVDAVQDINKQIAEITEQTDLDTGEGNVAASGEDSDKTSDSDKTTVSDDSSGEDSEDADARESSQGLNGSTPQEILDGRTLDIVVTDADGNVTDESTGDVSSDPLYSLYLDKEVALQSLAVAVTDAQGDVYTDDDMDGIISQEDMEPGDYVAVVMEDDASAIAYDPATYETAVNVKDKVEYKVVKEITKKVEADKPAEDAGKATADVTPVESTLTDTVEYVESTKTAKSKSYKATTSVKKPASADASKSKATVKSGGVTSVKHTPTASSYTITINYDLYDSDGKTLKTTKKAVRTITVKKDEAVTDTAENNATIDGTKYVLFESPTFAKATANATYTYKYKVQAEEKKTYTVSVKYEYYLNAAKQGETTVDAKKVSGQEGASYSITADDKSTYADKEYTLSSEKTITGTYSKDDTLVFTYKRTEESSDKGDGSDSGNNIDSNNSSDSEENKQSEDSGEDDSSAYFNHKAVVAAFSDGSAVSRLGLKLFHYTMLAAQTAAATEESASLDMTYSKGTFTIVSKTSATSVTISDIKINGTAVSGTSYAVKANGDYKLTGTVKWSDGTTDTSLAVTYTVSGITGDTTTPLTDTNGNQLYLDSEGKTKATAADYVEGKTYYYLEEDYSYTGWQSINGVTYYYDKNGNRVTGTQVIQGVSYNFGTDGALLVNGVGIDVSKWQGTIDWAQAKGSVAFAIVRCGYRGMYDGGLHEDPTFYTNMKNAKANGVKVGIYIYSTALTEAEAVEEASMAVSMANKAGGLSYPIYIDMEDTTRGVNKLSNEQRTAIINAFCTTVQSGGYKAGVYASKNWMTNYINMGSVSGSAYVWVAQYNTTCTYSGKYTMWQYSSKGSVPGIKGNVDMNKSYF